MVVRVLLQGGAHFEGQITALCAIRITTVADNGGANPASGYGLIEASDRDDAIAKAKGCPILQAGGSVELAEAFDM